MARKKTALAEVDLPKAIWAAIYDCYLKKKSIDREAFMKRYTAKNPKNADKIKKLLESQPKGEKPVAGLTPAQGSKAPTPVSTTAKQSSPQVDAQRPSSSTVSQKKPPTAKASASAQKVPEKVHPITGHRAQASSSENSTNLNVADLPTNDVVNIRLQEFNEHLAGKIERAPGITPSLPSLEVQLQFMTSSDDKMEGTNNSVLEEHAVLVSPLFERPSYSLPSQCALLGKIVTAGNEISDPRIMLNTNIPFSAFVCGVQGSGKSHTTACIIENCSMDIPALGTLQSSITTLVLQYDEYTSTASSQPNEAAFLARVLPQYAYAKPVPIRVLVSPTNFHNLKKMYSQIPNVEVRPFKLQPDHLNISMMLSLMSFSQSGGMPLYMAQVTRVLREMAIKSGGRFDYSEFRVRLKALDLDRSQTPFLSQRLDLLDSYLDLAGKGTDDYFIKGGVTILDLSCPFVDQSTACILFRIAIDLFLHAHQSRGKMIVADEAHKYMADGSTSNTLTETFLTIIRQQRHLGVRIIISTQEPTISPRLIDLCSLTIIHRFTSPQWYEIINSHVPMKSESTRQEGGLVPGDFHRIASLGTGEAIVFASSAHVIGRDDVVINTPHETFKMKIRSRVTWDGGKSIVCIR
ncbi:hypothetical protein N7517_004470 [Penicillium concentricum]|uniref:Zona occludens toxin N-terminal domain-containing protein n=1 Tax=Penicillium concentricum TaxID=293559 RepID=A0A9W9S7M4_9EURO|nr:uncharacterized protein N7517_004470 [Penicillium concentricum]KAJ5372464.1 hypothetical protein N7517_004470 [Penicillium concentricum]